MSARVWAESGITVVMPTVPERAQVLAETLRQWRELGVADPVVVEQESPLRHASQQNLTARRAIRAGLERSPRWVLLTEDDVDLSPCLPSHIPYLLGWGEAVVSLYAPGWTHYSKASELRARGGVWDLHIARVMSPRRWYGSLGVLIPARLAAEMLLRPPHRDDGFDVDLGQYVLGTHKPFLVSNPNLVQQRDVRPVSNPHGGRHRSMTYGRCRH